MVYRYNGRKGDQAGSQGKETGQGVHGSDYLHLSDRGAAGLSGDVEIEIVRSLRL